MLCLVHYLYVVKKLWSERDRQLRRGSVKRTKRKHLGDSLEVSPEDSREDSLGGCLEEDEAFPVVECQGDSPEGCLVECQGDSLEGCLVECPEGQGGWQGADLLVELTWPPYFKIQSCCKCSK